jgi:hypothetical protein
MYEMTQKHARGVIVPSQQMARDAKQKAEPIIYAKYPDCNTCEDE